MSIQLEGGPLDGDELHGLTARNFAGVDPPFVCYNSEGRWEHYVRVLGEDRFVYANPCHRLALGGAHPDCGHDHAAGW